MLRVENLSLKRGTFELHIDKFIIKPGINLLLGPNGGGKTTFLKSLAGLLNYSGLISFNNEDVSKRDFKSRAKIFSYLPQAMYLPDLRVEDLLISGRFPYTNFLSSYDKKDWDIVYEYAESMNILPYMKRNIAFLSQGELQRVMLAKIFIQATDVLLLDEPTSALDLGFKEMLKQHICQYLALNKESTIIISTHEPEFFSERCSSVTMLKDGHILKEGTYLSTYTEANKKELFGLL